MADFLEVWRGGEFDVVALDDQKLAIGKAETNDVVLSEDTTVSHLHAALEQFGAGWCLRDLGSRNGTFVNGERIFGDRTLRHGDEIRVGRSRFVFRAEQPVSATLTDTGSEPPNLTARERDVLTSLCRPLLTSDVFTEPASIRQMASDLVVSEAAIKQHLARIYDKFEIEEGEQRRVRLANDAIQRGAVTLAELRAMPD